MRALYTPLSDHAWAQYYAGQATQSGAGFQGLRYQRGAGLGSIFRGLFRFLLPVAKSAGKAVGKQALATGAQIASDVVGGANIKTAAKRRARAGAAKLMKRAARKIQTGKGLGRRPPKKRAARKKPRKSIKRTQKRKATTTRRQTKKRKVADQLGFYYK